MDEYRTQFPNQGLQRSSREHKEKQSRTQKARLQDPGSRAAMRAACSTPAEIRHWTRQGLSEEKARVKVSEHQRCLALQQNNPETKERQSKRNTGDANHMSLSSIAERHDVTREEASKMTPCYGRTGESHPMFGKHHTEEALRKIAENTPQTFYNVSQGEIELGDVSLSEIKPYIISETKDLNDLAPAVRWEWVE